MKFERTWCLSAVVLLAAACAEQEDGVSCPGGGEPIRIAEATSCVVAVVETGFLCSGDTPHQYEAETEGVVVCSDSADLTLDEVREIVAEHAARNSRADDALADAGPPDGGRPDAAPRDDDQGEDDDGQADGDREADDESGEFHQEPPGASGFAPGSGSGAASRGR